MVTPQAEVAPRMAALVIRQSKEASFRENHIRGVRTVAFAEGWFRVSFRKNPGWDLRFAPRRF